MSIFLLSKRTLCMSMHLYFWYNDLDYLYETYWRNNKIINNKYHKFSLDVIGDWTTQITFLTSRHIYNKKINPFCSIFEHAYIISLPMWYRQNISSRFSRNSKADADNFLKFWKKSYFYSNWIMNKWLYWHCCTKGSSMG